MAGMTWATASSIETTLALNIFLRLVASRYDRPGWLDAACFSPCCDSQTGKRVILQQISQELAQIEHVQGYISHRNLDAKIQLVMAPCLSLLRSNDCGCCSIGLEGYPCFVRVFDLGDGPCLFLPVTGETHTGKFLFVQLNKQLHLLQAVRWRSSGVLR